MKYIAYIYNVPVARAQMPATSYQKMHGYSYKMSFTYIRIVATGIKNILVYNNFLASVVTYNLCPYSINNIISFVSNLGRFLFIVQSHLSPTKSRDLIDKVTH
jgi:hypothetical protein